MDELEVKMLVRRRDRHRCTACGITQDEYKRTSGKRLDVHRLQPGTPYTVIGCVTLCRPCHKQAHRDLKRAASAERRLVGQIVILAERAYRRGFQHGYLASRGKLGCPAPTPDQVHDWRFAANSRRAAVAPPGCLGAGCKDSLIGRAAMETCGTEELWELLCKYRNDKQCLKRNEP